ncbi:hypothetical protein JXA48_00935 [Candidatus Woesearchaeota archaeon]|nr:hypothetical protein [Candidatus Woesearchaeota archaeon]
MRRGRAQATYRYLPGMFIDFEDGNCIAFIDRWDSYEVKEGINKKRIVEKIKEDVKRFGEAKLFNDKTKDDYVILSPRYGIDVELSPLTFICEKCGLAHSYFNLSQFGRMTNGRYTCSGCGGKLKQLDLIYKHSCGYAGQVPVRACPTHGKDNMRLVRGSSIGENRWVCEKCGHKISLNTRCPNCNDPKFIHPVPFRQGDVFQRKGFPIINLPFLEEDKLYSIQSSKLIIGDYLGLVDQYGFKLTELLEVEDHEENTSNEDLQKDISKWRAAGMDDKQIELILGSNVFSKTVFKIQEVKNKIISEIDTYITLKPEDMNAMAIALFEYLETLKSKTKKHVNDVIDEAKKTNSPILGSVTYFPDLFKKIGVSNPYVINDLSIVNATYGFTREVEEGPKSSLIPFNWDRLDGKRLPVYINKTEAEAIILEFDRLKIIKWLFKNKIISQMPTELDEKSLKLWFLKNIHSDAITRFNEVPVENNITKAVYGLLHTISHTLLKRASSQCGLDKDSLGELIFAEIPAIIIYSNNSTSFQLGGLFTLFESKVRPWIDLAIQDVENCIYDPLCIHDKGSCHACLFTSEISCEHSNKDLDRNYLIGGKYVGFWNKRFIEEVKNE